MIKFLKVLIPALLVIEGCGSPGQSIIPDLINEKKVDSIRRLLSLPSSVTDEDITYFCDEVIETFGAIQPVDDQVRARELAQRHKYDHVVATLADPSYEIDLDPAPAFIGFVRGEQGEIGMRVYHVDVTSEKTWGITIIARQDRSGNQEEQVQ